jgi:ribosomal protein L44E
MLETPENLNPQSGSLNEVSASLNFDTKGDERLLTVMYRELQEVKKKLHEVETQKVLNETQLPPEVLEENGLLPEPPKHFKRGKGYRPIMKSEIEEVQKQTPFAAAQARLLGCHFSTYKKYCKMYGIWNPKPNEKGKRNMFDPSRGKYPLTEILEGKHPHVSDWMVKDKLIRSGTFPPKCNICGYDKRRIVDKKICLLLDHMDGDQTNFKRENLQLLCLNCTYECGRGYIRRGKHLFDPDWMQGAEKDEIDERNRW